MDEKLFYDRVQEVSNIYSFDANEIYELLKPHNAALSWITKQKGNATTYTKFKNHLEFTKEVFSNLNDHIKNDGYKKLSKRCEVLLSHLEKHRKNEPIPPKVKSYFNSIFNTDLPTESNILSIAKSNLEHFLIQASLSEPETENILFKDYCKDIIRDIFDKDSFNITLKYTTIKIHTGSINIMIYESSGKKGKQFIFSHKI